MVSIPDWAKFSRLHDFDYAKSSTTGQMSPYYKKREQEAVKQAELNGYFVVPTYEYLMEKCWRRGKARNIKALLLVKLDGVHLRRIGDISYCINLKICILSNNFLEKIDGLVSCRQLVKLDVHGNQLSSVPGIAFWSGLRNLKFLYLHDNPLGKFETLYSLATCPQLIALTLFDTPLSIRKNYRHHVVNSVWSLKALDSYVISDEEIIEDASFGGQFGTMQPPFKIDLCKPCVQGLPKKNLVNTIDQEMKCIKQLEAEITRILAHWSPIHIIQRYLRGYLCRKKYRDKLKPQTTVKSPKETLCDVVVPPPPSTPSTSMALNLQDLGLVGLPTDYDTYMQNRRPGSDITDSSHRIIFSQSLQDISTGQDEDKQKKNLVINMSKLKSFTLQTPQEEITAMDRVYSMTSREGMLSSRSKAQRRKQKKLDKKQKRIRDPKVFFGPVVPCASPEPDMPVEAEDVDPKTSFRLQGQKPNILYVDPTTEMILGRREIGKAIRDAEYENHNLTLEKYRVVPLPPQKRTTLNQRLFSKVHGTMGMSCLLAVQKAYKDRENAEKYAAKMERIFNMRQERNRAKDRINFYHEEKRNHVQKKRDEDRARMLDALEKHDLQRLNYLDKRQEFKIKSADIAKSLHADNTFVSDFSNQHTSVSIALLRHDRQTRSEDQTQAKINFVQNRKQIEMDQLNTVKKFLEHRQLIRQSETAAMKSELGTKMLQETNEKMMEARARVEKLKARQATVQAFYSIPPRELLPLAGISPGRKPHPGMDTLSSEPHTRTDRLDMGVEAEPRRHTMVT